MSSVDLEPAAVAARDGGVAPAVERDTYGELGMLHRSLAEYCRAGVPLPNGLQLLHADAGNGALRRACEAMARDVDGGMPFADAYGQWREHFPPVYRALLEAGASSGDLPGVLDEIATHASLRARVRDQLRHQLEYPLWVAGFVLAIGAMLLLVIGPFRVSAVVDGHGLPPPASPPTWLALSGGAAMVALLVLIVLVVAWLRRPLEAAGPRGLRFRVPLIGRLRGAAAVAGFASTMALLLRRQLPLDRALALCAETCDSPPIRSQVERMAACAEQGGGLAASLRTGDLVPPSLLWFVESAASSCSASRALEDIAGVYRQRVGRAADRAAVFAVPLVQLFAGLVVLLFALAYAFPTFQVFNGVLYGW